MQNCELSFATYGEVIAQIERLEASGCQQLGQWNLGQACRHLSYYFRGSLEGYDIKLPWLVRMLIGRPILKWVLNKGHMPASSRTIPASVPEPDTDQSQAVAEAKELLGRLENADGQLHPSPLFDRLTIDQWRTLHLIHAAHHLGLLVPEDGGGGQTSR
jgi:uncharacterized protein DUF1569